MKPIKKQKVETRLPSAPILANPLLYVRPSSECFQLHTVSYYLGCVPGSVGTRQALLQGWLLCVGFVCLANVPDLVHWLPNIFRITIIKCW